ncbi:polyketide synthase [Aspergillus sclerotioniger CBS 115572]|uniref:Polyketide synthase n=1 Tax=Aspergillus sclerotioniger CBS 115572 TaxID=1450535 RepID=A0A317X828_9EURO|nr:polyketide synthase [Aspergillus sclerotioniger CBS 115572]PWY94774.1 polyketide synthase [Aspergillus sclerotioniger CBS 115572]
MTKQDYLEEPIAIIGSSCRFPGGASSPSKLWDLLHDPRDVLKEFDPDRMNLKRFYHTDGEHHGSTNVTNKSYTLEEDTRVFDAAFFGITPMEARGMDPQQRLLLEAVYEAFESAGMTLEQFKGSLTSVHVGVMTSDWTNIQLRDPETLPQYAATGTANSILSNRISYIFDLKGPSVTVDTACSSSLVALHQAARGLLDGDSETAIVAGVNIILDPTVYITESKLHMLSPDARSRMWDKGANGYARGEGTAALVLKRLSQALADGDDVEAIIRGSGVNSDGQSPGITMPFAPTQAQLIRHVYRRAGLDPSRDRPQYFECHGTGTPAGDPIEARAISEAFSTDSGAISTNDPMYVGSIKTVIGHLEGCAGLAGVMKSVLAIKHRVIPPNLHFNELNPAIAPFYGPLRIPTTPVPWPKLHPGEPARVSVNSFGFGGTNAHAIIESFEDNTAIAQQPSNTAFGPLLFSAASGTSLLATVRAHLQHLKKHPEVNLSDLSSLLQTRRSTHRVRAHFSSSSRDDILASMEHWVTSNEKIPSGQIGYHPRLLNPSEVPGVLGIFTGQGAQWPAMGRELLDRSPVFCQTIADCEAVLRTLPAKDRPTWSLERELRADAASSRISEAAICQPLCTAVQIGLVDILTVAGVHFDAVIGHSSGEIAAVYASGIINRAAAVQIAYYRGLHARLAQGGQGQSGGMLAVGVSLTEATQFCSQPRFGGRLSVAASNAPQSVTLSGDLDAIREAKDSLDADGIFARHLKVDTAYHSHHMQPCSDPYLQSLLACNIEVKKPAPGKAIWSSSVRGDTELLNGDLDDLKGSYWVSNMLQTVMFSQALESSIWHGGPFDLAIEVGPHPALKGPVEQTLKAVHGPVPPYTGLLKRGASDMGAFSTAIGSIWAQLGPSALDFAGFRRALSGDGGNTRAALISKDLPAYPWEHDKLYWRESAISRRYRIGDDVGHELLGRPCADSNPHELRWRNILQLGEIPWLRGHEVLGEVLLPAAAYVSLALEAGQQMASRAGRAVKLFEVENIDILRPVVVPDNKDGVETVFAAHLSEGLNINPIRARISYYVCPDQGKGTMVHVCNGALVVHLGELPKEEPVLPPRQAASRNDLVEIDCDRAYNMFHNVGLNYAGSFRAMTQSKRVLGYSTSTAVWSSDSLSDNMILHPAMLDVAFQSLFVALAHPASGQISSALLPSRVERVRVAPHLQQRPVGVDIGADIESWVVQQSATSLVGDLNVYDCASGLTFAQVEGLTLNMIGEQDSSQDRPMFAQTVWAPDIANGWPEVLRDDVEDAKVLRQAEDFERVALFYSRRLAEEIATDERSKLQWYHQRMLTMNDERLGLIKSGQHPIIRSEWLDDGPEALEKIDQIHGNPVQLRLLHAVGSRYPRILRGEVEQLQVMNQDNLLNRFFTEDLACLRVNQLLADAAHEITFKYPRSNILEIGGGAGGTARTVLNKINDAYASYTFTDISSVVLAQASETFADFASKMKFATLDINDDPSAQGFAPNSYDIIVASNVLHATKNLQSTMNNVRSMLRPGGYLLISELTGMEGLSKPFLFSGLPTWWIGEEPDRQMQPIVPILRWDEVLRETGFSGIDMELHDTADEATQSSALLVTQAISDSFLHLREPLLTISANPAPVDGLVLIGGKKFPTTKILTAIQKLLPQSWRGYVRTISSVDAVETLADVGPNMDIICLHDHDEPLFASTITESRLTALQGLLMRARNLIWATSATNGHSHPPRATMIHGISRIMPVEMPHIYFQVLGLEAGLSPSVAAQHCLEAYLRVKETRQELAENPGNVPMEGKLLWAREPEVEVLKNGTVIIPRVIPDHTLNSVFLAAKRTVTQSLDATHQPVQAVAGSTRMTIQAINPREGSSPGTVPVQVEFALHIPARNGDGVYLISGRSLDSLDTSIAASEVNASVVHVPTSRPEKIASELSRPAVLFAAANHVLSRTIADLASPGKPILVYGAEPAFASGIADELARRGIHPYFASSESDAPDSWIKVHAQSSKRAIKRILPHDVAVYVDLSPSPSSIGDHLRGSLPTNCTTVELDRQLLRRAFLDDALRASAMLGKSHAEAHKQGADTELSCEVIEAPELANATVASLETKYYVTDWRKRDSLTVTVPPLEPRGLFRPDRTYLMVGAAGGLGLSLCKWILEHGAKHLIITSRNPTVDPAVLEDARRVGASIHVLPMDVTDRASIERVVQHARDTLPPIAGVCQCAMVLRDRLFLDMSIDELNGTLAAKVDGTENLDAVFGDAELDFFVMLSSSATAIGNIGQANYHIGNMFMTNVAAQRRARGLAGSVIHIGHVTDVGYIVKTKERTDQLAEHFGSIRMMPLSETDVHHAFAQAVRNGRPGSQLSSDIIMGIEPPSKPSPRGLTDDSIHWLKNPRLSHMTPIASLDGGANGNGQTVPSALGSVCQRVEDAETEEKAVSVVIDAFCAKLDKTLQLPDGRAAENADRAVIDFGIDSLVAVEIRNWFLKELSADVPVVKVLGGDSVLQICTTAARTVLARSMRDERKKPKADKAVHSATPAPPELPVSALQAPCVSSVPVSAAPVPPPATTITTSADAIPTPGEHRPVLVGMKSSSTIQDENWEDSAASSPELGSSSNTSLHELEGSASPLSEVISEEDLAKTNETKLDAGKAAARPVVVREERMSRAQARIWFLSKHARDPAAYNMVFHYQVNGKLNMMRLRRALEMTTDHHECLKMCFYQRVGDGQPMQGLMKSSAYQIEHITDGKDDDLKQVMACYKTRVWDLEAGQTMGVAVISRSADKHDFVFGYHHIVTDVVGWLMFLQTLDPAYRLHPLSRDQTVSHIEYTRREQEQEAAGRYTQPLEFWQKEFATLPEPLPLLPSASVRTRPTRQPQDQDIRKIQSQYRTLSPDVVAMVQATCRRLRVSPFHFYFAVLQVFLTQLAGIEDVCTGIVDANRGYDELAARMVGCFVNVLPVKGRVARGDTFAGVARNASRKALETFAHAGVPFDVLLDALNTPRWADGDTAPLFQVAINYRAAGWGELPLGADCRMALTLDDGKDAEPPYDISLGIMDLNEGCTLDFHCQGALYSAEATAEMSDSYVRLVEAFAANPDMVVEDSPVYDGARVSQACELGRGPEIDFSWPATLSQRFKDVCRLHGEDPAVIDDTTTLSYDELAPRVDSVSMALKSAGCVAGDRVAVLCEPSVDSVIALLAVLQSGCVYMPLDTSLPAARHAAMIRTAEPSLLLYNTSLEDVVLQLAEESIATFQEICIDDVTETSSGADMPCPSDPSAPAILLFTSGSTGTPKGILLTQGNFVNHLALKVKVLGLGQEQVLQHSSLGFDMSVVQTFCALANGGCLVVASRHKRRDPVALTSLLHKHRISLTIATPSEYLAWCRYGSSSLREHVAWRHACMGGEPISLQLRKELLLLGLKGLQFTNCYGPTEITAAATFQLLSLDDPISSTSGETEQQLRLKHAVGKALPNYTVRIVDSTGRPQPVNHNGEICIGGKGVALGYFGLPTETAHKFFIDLQTGQRLYRTSDQGRLLPDGTLLCFGRLEGDTQVKLRGLRVELEDVEAALLRAAGGLLSSIVVSAREEILVAHATVASSLNRSVSDSELAGILRRTRLPQYFIPAAIIVLHALPTNANGKLNRKAIAGLPIPTSGVNNPGEAQEEVTMNIQQGELRLLWERVLPASSAATFGRITPSSDFFLRGGNSMLLMRLQTVIRESMGVQVSTRDLYRASTLADMAKTVFEGRQRAAAANGDPEDIEWATETAIPEWLKQRVQQLTPLPAEPKTDGLQVVLTGATGFLGGRILQTLLQSPAVQKVHCIAIGVDDTHAIPQDKVQYYQGNLADPKLGITEDEHALLERTADVIIHAGSHGHCLNNYATLQAPNVAATHRLAALALPRSVPLLFISSNRVSLLAGQTEQPPVSMANFAPPVDGREGLTATKWVGESFLESLHDYYTRHQQKQKGTQPHRPWSVAVHRPCIVVGDQAPNSDSMNAILRFSLMMRCAPLVKHGRGYIDFKPVDEVAADIVEAAMRMTRASADDQRVQFLHSTSGVKVPLDGFREHLEKVYGGQFEAVEMQEWVGRASKAGIDPLITAYLNGVMDTDEEMVFPYLGA